MAGRSDRLSKFPRQLKRQLALRSSGDAHREGEVRRLMIMAHAEEKRVRNGRMAGKIPCTLEKQHQNDAEVAPAA